MAFFIHSWFVTLFIHLIPTRTVTKLVQPVFYVPIPRLLRTSVFRLYDWIYGPIDWDEFEKPMVEYRSLNEMFTRKLAHRHHRNINASDVVSPADGTVASFGKIEQETQTLEQIKGVRFKLPQFLQSNPHVRSRKNNNDLYYVIVYLSPGDYHRFHSPVDEFNVENVRHIAGDLHPVHPAWLKQLPGLFAINERVVLSGKWRDDLYFAYVPVGAFNVGSITINDHELCAGKQADGGKEDGVQLSYDKGDEIGYFSFGSTVVLVFEAPDFRFSIREQQKVKVGQSFGDVIE